MKWIGAFLCFLTSLSIGWMAGKNERKRTEECEAFLELFIYIQNQVSYFSAPTKWIYQNFHNGVLKKTGFLDALCVHESDEVYFDAWDAALKESRENLKLSEEQFEMVRAFGACVGKSNEELQLKQLEYHTKAFRKETEKQKLQMQKNIKLYRTLGFSAGASILILVI